MPKKPLTAREKGMKRLWGRAYYASRETVKAIFQVASVETASARRRRRDDGLTEQQLIGYELGVADTIESLQSIMEETYHTGIRPRKMP